MSKNFLNGLTATLFAVVWVACATASPPPFRIVAMGDSLIWGQGLLEGDKIHNRLTNMLHDCLGYGPFDITQLAHSGVPIGVEGENGDTHDYPGEIPWFDPTILKQCEVFTNAPEGVNLVLLDGGINDVGPNNVLDPCLSTNRLSTDLEAHFHLRMSNLLEKVSRKFTTATVIVCNGYPFVSEESAAGLVPAFLTAMGVNCLSNVITDVIVAKCRQVVMEGAQKLMAAVDDVNTRNLRVGRSVRIVFADPGFGPANAIFAPESWLWGGRLNPDPPFWPPLLPEDPLASQRLCECSNAMPALEFGRSNLCVIAGGGHPNLKGAQAYADAAFAAYLDTDGLVRWNGGNGEWHTAANWTPHRVPGSDDTVLITNGTVEVNSPATAGHVIVKGGTLTHRRGVAGGLQLTVVGTLRVLAGGRIDVTDRGYLGGLYPGNGFGGQAQTRGPGGVPAPGAFNDSGGSYGSLGGGANSNPLYGSETAPVDLGSGGGSTAGGHTPIYGGNGGGRMELRAQSLVLEGALLANGAASYHINEGAPSSQGGGSGGSIYVVLSGGTFSGSGVIEARGGASTTPGRAGGGGRIAIDGYTENTFGGQLGRAGTVFTQAAGTGGNLQLDATTLTIAADTTNTYGSLSATTNGGTIYNHGTLVMSDDTLVIGANLTLVQDGVVKGTSFLNASVGSVTVQSNGVITHTRGDTNGVQLNVAGTLTVEAGGRIDVTDRGYLGGLYPGNGFGGQAQTRGPGGVPAPGAFNDSGGSYGSLGGGANSNPLYGSETAPVDLGSGGGSTAGGHTPIYGGNGGGRMELRAQSLVLEGALLANGAASYHINEGAPSSQGGGSGGSIYVVLSGGTFSGSGVIEARGGASTTPGRAGGGGRIAIDGYTENTFGGQLGRAGTVFTQAAGTGGNLQLDATTLTIAADTTNTYGSLSATTNGGTIYNHGTLVMSDDTLVIGANLTLVQDGVVKGTSFLNASVGSVTVQSNGVITHTRGDTSGVLLNVAGTLTVEAGGRIDVTDCGYLGGLYPGNGFGGQAQTRGPGGAPAPGAANDSGGSYGSLGGGPNSNPLYGSETAPVDLGSGGGSAAGGHTPIYGGNGGGRMELRAQNLVVEGALLANGAASYHIYEGAPSSQGGGSGGSIYVVLSGGTFSGNGVIEARGGASTTLGRDGGCGRIAVVGHGANAFAGTLGDCGTLSVVPRPILSIRPDGTNAVISWPLSVAGFTLEYTTQLGSGVWTAESASVVGTATEHTVTVPAIAGRRFYRLKK